MGCTPPCTTGARASQEPCEKAPDDWDLEYYYWEAQPCRKADAGCGDPDAARTTPR
ncbi:MAG: hypothetical protein ABIO70_27205 [Pseudomonadota bacterium]